MPGITGIGVLDDGGGFRVTLIGGREIVLRKNNIPGNIRNSGDRQLIEDWINTSVRENVAIVITQTPQGQIDDEVDPDLGKTLWPIYIEARVRSASPLIVDVTVEGPRVE